MGRSIEHRSSSHKCLLHSVNGTTSHNILEEERGNEVE